MPMLFMAELSTLEYNAIPEALELALEFPSLCGRSIKTTAPAMNYTVVCVSANTLRPRLFVALAVPISCINASHFWPSQLTSTASPTMWCFPKSGLALWLSFGVYQSHALVMHGTRVDLRRPPSSIVPRALAANVAFVDASGTLASVPFRYITTITVNGQNLRVILDTGSSDIFILPHGNLPFKNSGIPITNSYGGGDVNGTIGFGTVQLGDYTFDGQAFNNATSVTVGDVLNLGLDGLIGVSFDGQGSPIQATLSANGWNPALGEPFLYNIFAQTPDQNNFIGVSLSRTGDLEGSADASFTINEIDEAYAAVVKAPSLLLFPGTNGRWSILLDGISVNGVSIPLPPSTVPNAPPGKIGVLMDSGTPTGSLPGALIGAIYSSIPGAQYTNVPSFGPTWTIPCDSTAIVTVYFGGQPFPIHPLDLSDVFTDPYTGLTSCISPLGASPGDAEFDGIFGDTFLRNMYSVYNFGDAVSKAPTGAASMQLLSQTDPVAAAADVLKVRMPRISPVGSAAAADDLSSSSSSPTKSVGGGKIAGALENDSTNSSSSDDEVKKWAPIVVGLLGANLLVVLFFAVIALALCIKRGNGGKRDAAKSTYRPLRLDEARALDGLADKRYSD
ncbi:aspartic peptidase domain-containing protein [Mycena latifolia]|nr:aspartic peptidase domain-containing protein [Mycena latifolia]